VSCTIHSQLNDVWNETTKAFSDAVSALTGSNVGTMSGQEYRALVARVEECRLASENARMAVQLHRKEHDC
jgi:hypothetical protein